MNNIEFRLDSITSTTYFKDKIFYNGELFEGYSFIKNLFNKAKNRIIIIDAYLDYSYDEAREKFAEYITIHGIKRSDVDLYIRKYPLATFKFYYELGLDHVLA